jgi:protein-disulfide isomerase
MNKSVAIIVALVVIVGGGAAYYLYGNRAPTNEAAAPAAASADAAATTAPATTSAEATAEATASGSSAAATTTAPAAPASTDAATEAPAAGATSSAGTTTQTAETAAPAAAEFPPPVIGAEDRVLGNPDAPVTIIEYASMTCPHCASFSTETMPKLKSEFIDKGQVRYVFRPFPLDRLALRASLMADCVPGDGYFAVLDKLFATQKDWTQAANPLDALRQIGKDAGIEESKIDACMTDEKTIDRIAAGYKEAVDVYGVNSTPSFLINGKKYAGALPFDDLTSSGTSVQGLSTIVRELLPK